MAIYHLNAKVISRGKGQSAIAAAAYRSGEKLIDEQTGEVKHYAARSERILFADIMAPKDAAEWAHDRNALWNSAERSEKRKDAQLAREIEVALPHELTAQQREYLVKDFAREAFVRKGYVVDIAIHGPDRDSDARNHHAHLMVTRRTIGPDGFSATKDWQFDPKQLAGWREQWSNLANRHLERYGHEARVDHRSLDAQGVEREATTHLGYAAAEMTRRGVQSDRFDELKGIHSRNMQRGAVRDELAAIDRELGGLEQEKAEAARAAEQARTREAAAIQQTPAPAAPERSSGENARAQAPDIRTDQREERSRSDQAAWQKEVAARAPADRDPAPVRSGLHVVDGATRTVTSLGDFMTDLMAGPSAQQAPKQSDMKAFISDPAARKEQQLARLAASRQAETAEKAIERIREDMQAGRNLKAEDIRSLTHQHQMQIHSFGDTAVRQMVDDARKRSEVHWKGQERERER